MRLALTLALTAQLADLAPRRRGRAMTYAVAASSDAPHPGPIWPYSPSYVTRHVGVICKRAGVPVIGMHGFRHSAASILLAEGVDPLTIRGILGHVSVSMTAHYARSEEPQRREALERLGRAVSA